MLSSLCASAVNCFQQLNFCFWQKNILRFSPSDWGSGNLGERATGSLGHRVSPKNGVGGPGKRAGPAATLVCNISFFAFRFFFIATGNHLHFITGSSVQDTCGFNMAALRFLQLNIEEHESVKLFTDAAEKKQQQKRKKSKAYEQAFVVSMQ